jgi:hypothetical protein
MAAPNHFTLEVDHHLLVKVLAEEIHVPVEEVSEVYASTLQGLKTNSRIQNYLPVLASKKVRDRFRH